MKIIVLGSSSKGNSTFVEINNIKFLIDVGLSYKYISNKLNNKNININTLDFVIITHAHSDHINSLNTFARKKIPIYMGVETFNEINKKYYNLDKIFFIDELTSIKNISLTKIPISHDKKGFGFIFEYGNDSLVYMADTGIIYSRYFDKMKNKKIYLLESNHDIEMEMNGTKDEKTKIRNIGDEGHISNYDCANKYLPIFVGNNTKCVILIHISEHDNTYELAYKTSRKVLDKNINLLVAKASEATELIEI